VATEPSDTEKTALAAGAAAVALGEGADKTVVATGNNNEIRQDYSSQTNIFILPSATNSVPNSDQLSLILAKIDLLIVQEVYRLSLPIDASLWGLPDGRIEDRQVVSELQDLRNSPDFISHLISDGRLSQPIRDELSQAVSNSDVTSCKSIKLNENRVIESYLSSIQILRKLSNG
jgi:hypothetical protein